MTQYYYLQYQFELKEPVIITSGSQIGNILQTREHIPGTTILGACAGLYLRDKEAMGEDGKYSDEFYDLFLSEKTVFSPAYPLVLQKYKTFPMPLSVFGCKHYGKNSPNEKQHGFSDYLCREVPDRCLVPGCGSPLEHKRGYAYEHRDIGYCNVDVEKRIISHNKVSDEPDDKRLFSFETLAEGQRFYGEIAFSNEERRDTVFNLLAENRHLKFGKARNRGYGLVAFSSPHKKSVSLRKELGGDIQISKKGIFLIYFFSDAILSDRTLNYCSCLNEEQLAFWMELESAQGLKVYCEPRNGYKSFWKNELFSGFNQKRGMPLPSETAISRGSVFTVSYSGDEDITAKLQTLEDAGLGLRRNEGFGQVVIGLRIHSMNKEEL